jgi:replication-associated recombination protein RarA
MTSFFGTQLKAIAFPNLQLTEGFIGRSHILTKIADWLQQKDQRFFILSGEPGVGKSAIAPSFPSHSTDIETIPMTARLSEIAFNSDIDRFTENFTGRQWVFDDIDRWLKESEERFFILTGEPRVGKSAIALLPCLIYTKLSN